MRGLIILVLFALPTQSYCQNSNMDFYQMAIIEIKNTDIFKSFSDGKSIYFQVMPELIPISQMGFVFLEELQEQTGIDYSSSKDKIVISKNLDLLKLSEKKKSDLRIVFSKIENDSFLAEVAYGRKSQKDWKSITMFGQSLIFSLKKVDEKVIIIKSAELTNN